MSSRRVDKDRKVSGLVRKGQEGRDAPDESGGSADPQAGRKAPDMGLTTPDSLPASARGRAGNAGTLAPPSAAGALADRQRSRSADASLSVSGGGGFVAFSVR